MNRRERRAAAARESKKPAKGPAESAPGVLHELGVQHMQAGRRRDAQLCCQQALAADPRHVDSLHLMGLLSLQARQYDEAIEWIARANRQDPSAEYLVRLGTALTQQGLRREAFKAFDAAVEIKPDDAELWLHHGHALAALQRPVDAVVSYEQVLKLNPRHAEAAYRCGFLLRNLNRLEEALACFDLCDELLSNQAAVLEQRGLVLHDLNRFEEALSANLRAHVLNPANPETCNNIGASLQWLRRDAEALPWFDKAVALKPGYVTALINKASALTQVQRFDEAIAVYAQARAIAPNNANVDWNLSLLHLLTGDFEAGWVGREARWKTPIRPGYPAFSQPIWIGDSDIDGKTILVCADEGLGDTIQFARFIPMLAARGARVILVVDEPLFPMLSGLSGVSQCLLKSAALPAFDLHCPISTLPLAFGTRLETIPPDTSYLPRPADARVQAWEDRLQNRLGPYSKPRVGLVWSGRANHMNDHNRSLPKQKLSRLLDLDAAFVSLQKDPRPDDRALLDRTSIVDLTSHLTDFSETAALASCLDLVITVDTSVAHLAGALDRATWILLPYTPDYRWLLGRDDSPWYGSVRLFRQDERRDYATVIERVREALQALISAWSSRWPTDQPRAGSDRC
jgi:tetratricopeptide (TPR) repeat protein/ADP-heptose:LPS heptosyltransferase